MKFETTEASESIVDNNNDINNDRTNGCCCCTSIPPIHTTTTSSVLLLSSSSSSSHQTFTDNDDEDVLDTSKPSTVTVTGTATVTVTVSASLDVPETTIIVRPSWWSSQTRLSRRSLLEESLDEIEDRHVNNRHGNDLATPTGRPGKRKAHSHGDAVDGVGRQMRMFLPPTAFRSSKLPRRSHSMFASVSTSGNNNNNNNNNNNSVMTIKSKSMIQTDGYDDIEISPPPLSLFSDGSLSTTTSRTVTDAMSSEGLEDDHTIIENDLTDDDEVAMMASLMGRPILQRRSTIKDHFDLTTSIEAFRTSLLEQQQLQHQNDHYSRYHDENL
jgi:hypothetical protein